MPRKMCTATWSPEAKTWLGCSMAECMLHGSCPREKQLLETIEKMSSEGGQADE